MCRKLVKKGAVSVATFVLIIAMTACTNQATIAALVTVLGNAAASVAVIEGNGALAQKLQQDVAVASNQILNWKQGTNAQMAIQALRIVQDDLALFPQVGPYAPLIQLALATTISIIQILNPGTVMLQAGAMRNPPKNADQFKKQWNALVAQNPAASKAVIH